MDYRSDTDDLVNDFYVPCLSCSSRYDRAVGYFTSQGLSLAARGIAELIQMEGRMRLVFGALVKEEDKDEIVRGYEDRIRTLLEVKFEHELSKPSDDVARSRVASLAWLVSSGALEVKVAVRLDTTGRISHGIYHEKMGVFRDNYDNAVAFSGSSNETPGGLVGNFESNDVFRSWVEGESQRVENKKTYFENLWSNNTHGLLVLDFTEAAGRKLVKYRSRQAPTSDPEASTKRRVTVTPLPFQVKAIDDWKKAGFRGVLSMATGTGKTITALSAVKQLPSPWLCVVIVPIKDLVRQWEGEIRTVYGDDAQIRFAYSSEPGWESKVRHLMEASSLADKHPPQFVLTTYQTASRERFQKLLKGFPLSQLCVILDEAHHAGAAKFRKVFEIEGAYRMGLSATPEDEWDDDRNQALFEYLGPTVFDYEIADAIRDHMLCEYKYYIHPVSLTVPERSDFQAISRDITILIQILKNRHPRLKGTSAPDVLQYLRFVDPGAAARLLSLYLARVEILKKATAKAEALRNIVKTNELKRCVVYCNDLQHVKDSVAVLFDEGFDATEYSSDIEPMSKRRKILDSFEEPSNSSRFLVAVKCLDEGVNLPIMNSAILVSSSRSTREFVQRRGRILRRHPDKPYAVIHDIIVLPFVSSEDEYLVTPSEFEYVKAELDRVAHFGKNALNHDEVDTSGIMRMLEHAYYTKD